MAGCLKEKRVKKVKVATYCEWNSYGSVLQAWALKHHLSTLGCEMEHLRLRSISSDNLRLYFKGKSVKTLITNADRFLHRKQVRRRFALTTDFFAKHFRFLQYPDCESLAANPPVADAFLAGSDQIWNPNEKLPFFFLEFEKDQAKKISYAASMGVSKIAEPYRQAWYNGVSEFGKISVREAEVRSIIEQATEKEALVHVDPTFLVDKQVWRDLSKPYAVKAPYILVYALYWNKSLNVELKALHKKTGLPIIAIAGQFQQVYAQKKIYDASVEEFLWLFDHASYIVTSSFHGVAFSLIFEKKFSAVINPKKPARINAVLDTFAVENTNIADLDSRPGPNYEKIKDLILHERERSNEYLCQGLGLEECR